jgi:co-chaperonin GroES (HSP10)
MGTILFKPTQDYILIKPLKRLQSRVLEVVSNEKYSRGLVVACGPGERLKRKDGYGLETGAIRPMQVKVGDWITYVDLDHIYPTYFERGEEYRVLQDKDVCFISDREFVDAHHSLSDAEVDRLLAEHNQPLELLPESPKAAQVPAFV